MLKARAVLFDCDGTLIDSEDQTIMSINYALSKVHLPMASTSQIKKLFGPGADIILFKLIQDKAKSLLAFEYFLEHQKRVAASMNVYDGIRELLTHLKSIGIRLGIVTGRHSRDLEIVLKAHQLQHYFDIVIPDNILKNPKPDPEGIFVASEKLHLSSEFVYYVGDMKTDIEASKNARSKSIAALWDKRVDPTVMTLEKPWLLARHPSEIWEAFKNKF